MEEYRIKQYYKENPEGVAGIPSIPEIYEMHQLLAAQLKRILPQRLLDAGCGKGYTGESLFPLVSEYHGFDFSGPAITIARKRIPDGTFCEGSLLALPYPDGYFDCVVCSEVLEHVPKYVQAVSELARVLKPGGSILVTTPNKINPDMIWRTRQRGKYTEQIFDQPIHYRELTASFERAGLRIEEFRSFFFQPPGGEALPAVIRWLLMAMIGFLSRLSGRPLGLYLFFVIRKP